MQTNKYRQIFKLVSESFIKSDVKHYIIYRPQRCLKTTSRLATTSNDGRLEFSGGRAKLIVKLPARGEYCEFNLKLINQTVGDLTEQIKHEDKSIEKVLFYSTDGVRLAQNTSLGILVSRPFQLKINELTYNVESPQELVKQSEIDLELEKQSKSDLEQVKQLVSKLYLHLNIEQYEQEREQFILKQLEALKSEIEPMERVKEELALKAKRHTNRMVWLGLGAMSIQMGILARLTWFDYSWDIVEPISYFVSYSAVIGVYAYFVLTRKEYDYESASDRIFLRYFHKNASKSKLDVNRYNEIKGRIFSLESDLDRIKEAHLKNFEKHVQKN